MSVSRTHVLFFLLLLLHYSIRKSLRRAHAENRLIYQLSFLPDTTVITSHISLSILLPEMFSALITQSFGWIQGSILDAKERMFNTALTGNLIKSINWTAIFEHCQTSAAKLPLTNTGNAALAAGHLMVCLDPPSLLSIFMILHIIYSKTCLFPPNFTCSFPPFWLKKKTFAAFSLQKGVFNIWRARVCSLYLWGTFP